MFLNLLHYYWYKIKPQGVESLVLLHQGKKQKQHIRFESVMLKCLLQCLSLSSSIWLREKKPLHVSSSNALHLILAYSLIAAEKKRPQWKGKQETTVFFWTSAACNYTAQWTTLMILEGSYIWVSPLCTQILLWLPSILYGAEIMEVYFKKLSYTQKIS